MYQEDIVKSVKSLKKYLKRMKPTDEYVRGYKDAKVMIDQLLTDVLDILIPHLYCDKCGEYPKEHTIKIEHNMNAYDDEYIEVCDKCKNKE